MKAPRATGIATAAALALAAALSAQSQPTPERSFEGEIDVTEVLLDVLVTDRQGTVILGLGPGDFDVREDGRPVEVLSAKFYSHRSPAEAGLPGVAGDATPPAARYLLLLFDDQRQRSLDSRGLLQQQLRAGRDTREYLAGALSPDDWVAVLAYDKRLRLVTDFTRDRERIGLAVEAATTGQGEGANWPSRRNPEAEQPSLGRSLPAGDALRDASGTIYDALRLVAEAASGILGRKNLLLFTTGFGRVDRFGLYQPESNRYDPMNEALNDANVAVYTIDLTPPGTEHALSGALTRLASDTGAKSYRDVLHFATPLGLIARETSGYYLLAYRATHPARESGYQKVSVEARNPEFRVTARAGYRYGD